MRWWQKCWERILRRHHLWRESEEREHDEAEQMDAENVDQAKEAIGIGEAAAARRILEEVVAKAPEIYHYSYRKGEVLHIKFWDREEYFSYIGAVKSGRIRSRHAIAWVKSAYPRAHYYLAFLATEAGNFPQALTHLEAGLRLEPDQPYLLCEMAVVLHGLNEHEKAKKAFVRALTERAYSPPALRAKIYRGLGVCLIDMQKYDEARSCLEMSLQYAPDNPVALNELRYIRYLNRGGKPVESDISVRHQR